MHPLFSELPFPRTPLRAAMGLVVVAILAALGARLFGIPTGGHGDDAAPARLERDLRFVDRAAGGIDVLDARSGRTIDVLQPGQDGFIRATVRGLVRERKRRGLGAEVPFHLALHADGRLTLEDPATARSLELEAFGPANSGAFARLLGTPPAGTLTLAGPTTTP
ncbi:MAG TPA: photosynthetic complex assembly protein PuhC [Burkholderiaceae bacterium]|nr:photosynthetic complex assembly protein PuhC [Burkholderiaceae bacterium]